MTISMPVGPVADGPPVAEQYDWVAESGFSSWGYLPEWRLVVAPARGIFRAASAANTANTASTGRTELGFIEARRDREAIAAPWRGEIIEWLVQDGDPVGLGQPVARLLPDVAQRAGENDVPS
jgi:[acyl-carrier-protein] S-malonyltransferase